MASTGTWNSPFGYAGAFGYQEDATGLKLLGHWLYDSATGSFLTRDPIKDGRSWYGYCGGNPVTGSDAGGLRITWVYRLVNAAGELIKNGLTRDLARRLREHRKKFGSDVRWGSTDEFADHIPDNVKHGPQNREALDLERHRNLTDPGPENHEAYIKSRNSTFNVVVAVLTLDPTEFGTNVGPAIDPHVKVGNRRLTDFRINRWLGEEDEFYTGV